MKSQSLIKPNEPDWLSSSIDYDRQTRSAAGLTGLFHRELGFPAEALGFITKLTAREWVPQYTRHALRACLDDRYGMIKPGARLSFTLAEIVELEMEAGQVTKVVVRKQYDDRRDIIYVMLPPQVGVVTVKTVWSNLRSDQHTTLKENLYQRPTNKM